MATSQFAANAQIFTLTTGVYVQSTGRIIVGRTIGGSGMSRYALDAFTGTGTSDMNFGSNGEAIAAVTGTTDAVVGGVVLQPDGKIIVASGTIVPDSSFLTRYNPDGTLDATFGSGGRIAPGPFSRGSAVTLQPDGKILVTGAASPGIGPFGVEFLRHLLRVAGARLLVIWDGSPIHRRAAVKEFVSGARGKVWLEALPGYAPI